MTCPATAKSRLAFQWMMAHMHGASEVQLPCITPYVLHPIWQPQTGLWISCQAWGSLYGSFWWEDACQKYLQLKAFKVRSPPKLSRSVAATMQVTYRHLPHYSSEFMPQPHESLDTIRKQGCGTLPNLRVLKLDINDT